jgi:hypothetical protein
VRSPNDAEPTAHCRGRLEGLGAHLDTEALAAWTSASRSCWASTEAIVLDARVAVNGECGPGRDQGRV